MKIYQMNTKLWVVMGRQTHTKTDKQHDGLTVETKTPNIHAVQLNR